MVEVGDHDDCMYSRAWIRKFHIQKFDELTPVADQEPREAVVLDNVCGSIQRRCVGDSPNHGSNTDVGHDNCITLSFREKDRVG